ncbi:MAG: hypothetical protein ACM3WT_06820 [Bacillota bacterium]
MALRCSACGSTSVFPVSLFVLGSGRREFRCSCGQHILTISRKGADVWTQLACFLCDGVHLFKFADRSFWSREIKSILCPDTGAEIGYIGPLWSLLRVTDVRHEILPKMASLFNDSAVGLKVLNRLLELEDQGRLRCSKCNSPLEIEAYSEGVEVYCDACGTTLSVPVGHRATEETGSAPDVPDVPGVLSLSSLDDLRRSMRAGQDGGVGPGGEVDERRKKAKRVGSRTRNRVKE